MNLSVVILTKNEALKISRAIASIEAIADEIIVIDDESTDETPDKAKGLGAKVYSRKLASDFAKQRNFGLEKATGRWVLFLDADETITPQLAEEIKKAVLNPLENVTGYYLKRRDFLWGRQMRYGEFGGIYLLRLARKTAGKWRRAVHETWEIVGQTKKLKGVINHYPHQSLKEFTEHVRVFADIHAREHYKAGTRSSLFKVIFMQRFKFFNNYVLRGGFLDGQEGFVAAMMMSFHSFLAWSSLWLMQKYKHSQES